jgi:hypothetical protein
MKASTILVIIFALLIGGGLLAYYFEFVIPEREIAQRCANYVPNWMDFLECHGSIVIQDGWDRDYLTLKDHMHEYEVARIYNLNQYKYTDRSIYVKNRKVIEGSVSDGVKVEYYQRLFQNGKVSRSYYENVSEIPTYLVIDFKTGEVRAYKNIGEAPEDEQVYFIEIENR